MRGKLFTLAAVMLGMLPIIPADAATPGYVQVRDQAPSLQGFETADLLFDPAGFQVRGLLGRGYTHAAYGILPNGQIAVSTSSDGSSWTTPTGARVTRPGGAQLPFTVGVGKRLVVAYVTSNTLPHSNRFLMLYTPSGTIDERSTSNDPVLGSSVKRINNLRYALSVDGIEWTEDYDWRVVNNGVSGVITGSGSNTFREGIAAPSDLIFNPDGDCYSTVVTNELAWGSGSPFDCEFTLIYTAIDAAGNTSVAIAGGIFFVDIGPEFRGATVPALSRNQTSWSAGGVDRAHVMRAGTSWSMTFSGAPASPRCNTASDSCSAGTASSTNGTTFTPHRPSAASLSASLASSIAGQSVSVHDLQPVDLSAPEPRYAASFGGGTWNVYGADTVGTAPRLTFLEPRAGYVSANEPRISFLLNDDFGTNVGLDLGPLDVRIDGIKHSSPMTIQQTPLGQVTTPGVLFTIPSSQLSLPDGEHVLSVSAADRDGETVSGSSVFLLDRTKPASQIELVEMSGFTFPLNSMWVEGSATDPGAATGLQRMRGTVTNPLGQTRVYEEGFKQTNNVEAGFNFSNFGPITPNGGPASWDYTWAVPMDDEIFWALPGLYTIELQAFDFAGNSEGRSSANSRTMLLI